MVFLLILFMVAGAATGCGSKEDLRMTMQKESRTLSEMLQPVVGENETEVKINLEGRRQVDVTVPTENVDAPNLEQTANEGVAVIAERFEHAETIDELNIRFMDKNGLDAIYYATSESFTFSQKDIQQSMPQDSGP